MFIVLGNTCHYGYKKILKPQSYLSFLRKEMKTTIFKKTAPETLSSILNCNKATAKQGRLI